MTTLELIIQEATSLLISPIHLQTIKKHFFILSTGPSKSLMMHWLLNGLHLLNQLLLPPERIGDSSNGAVGNGRSSPECHALGDG